MTRKILAFGAVILLGGVIAFTAFAQQNPADTTTQEEPVVQEEQAVDAEPVPFHEILAEKLGIDVETLETAMEEAKAEFQAQLPERAQRFQERRQDQQNQQSQLPQGRFNQGQGFRQGGPHQGGFSQQFGGPGMVKTTITHEFYHNGRFIQSMMSNLGPSGGLAGEMERPGR